MHTPTLLQAKAGVIGLTKTVAKEWGAFNIRCNGLAYGFIASRLTADKKGGASMQVHLWTPCRQLHTWSIGHQQLLWCVSCWSVFADGLLHFIYLCLLQAVNIVVTARTAFCYSTSEPISVLVGLPL